FALADLNPATVPLALQQRPAGVPMLSAPFLDPLLRSCDRIGHYSAVGHGLEHLLEPQPWPEDVGHAGIELAIARVAQHHAIIGVEQEKAFRDALQRVSQPTLSLCCHVARVR